MFRTNSSVNLLLLAEMACARIQNEPSKISVKRIVAKLFPVEMACARIQNEPSKISVKRIVAKLLLQQILQQIRQQILQQILQQIRRQKRMKAHHHPRATTACVSPEKPMRPAQRIALLLHAVMACVSQTKLLHAQMTVQVQKNVMTGIATTATVAVQLVLWRCLSQFVAMGRS
jgi:DNA-binding phage protein